MAVNFQSGITGLFYDPYVYYISLSSRNTSCPFQAFPTNITSFVRLFVEFSYTIRRKRKSRRNFVQILGIGMVNIVAKSHNHIWDIIWHSVYGYVPYNYGL